MNTHYLQQLSFHKLEIHQPTASLHSFVLVRNSLLQSIRTQQEQDSWLDACFDELDPESSPTDSSLMGDRDSSLAMGLCYDNEQQQQQQQQDSDIMDDIDMLLLEEDDDDDDDDDISDDDGPVSPEQSTLLQQPHYRSRPFGSPAFFIPMDDDEDDDEDEDGVENTDAFIPADATTLPLTASIATTATSHYDYHTNNNDSSSSTKQVLGTKKGKSVDSGGGDSISDYWNSQQHHLPSLPPSL
ncbi:hypothetical protein BCR42DRAFT_416050 [Absidia repens]|uniref:Uncharacterized protein n=1 Tax=Absidia repens TaxID=90262 RepID=A0A1X2IGC7_9FUNG|nr:hypothetical protein BCR42DRAFT_416050 [Absidia repens]